MLRFLNIRLLTRTVFFCLLAPFETPGQHGESAPTAAELSVKKLEVAHGLSVELFASEPLFMNPVAFSIDERGRFFISETHRYKDSIFDITRQTNWLARDRAFRVVEDRSKFLLNEFATNLSFLTKDSELVRLVEDRDADGRAENSSVFAEGFNEPISGTAAGIFARNGQVFFTSIPDLWKFTYTNAPTKTNGSAFKTGTEKLSTGYGVHIGVSGHDLHGLARGPDGKIYFSCGDRGFSVPTPDGKRLHYPDTGGVLRCNPDGSDLEVFAIGLRNPQELAFDQFGNLFTDDNDTAGADKSRLIYVVQGADYGWRASYQFMDGFGPWVLEQNWLGSIDGTLSTSGEVAQGPAGLAYIPGKGLPAAYSNQFLACDFPRGVWSFSLQPKGAGFEVVNRQKFLWNLGATDVDFGLDGSAYVSDWGQSYNMPGYGRIYRVFAPGTDSNATPMIPLDLAGSTISNLVSLLNHHDLRVRLDAQFELVRRAEEGKDTANVARALDGVELSAPATYHRIWAWRQLAEKQPRFREKLTRQLASADPEILAQTLRALGDLAPARMPESLNRFAQHENARVRFYALTTIGNLRMKRSLPAVLRALRENADRDPYLVHAGVSTLAKIAAPKTLETLKGDQDGSLRRAALLALRRLERPEVTSFLRDANPRLVAEAARAINDVPIEPGFPRLAELLEVWATRATTNATEPASQIVRRAINAHFRLGKTSNAEALGNFATNSSAPATLRAEAIDALADWTAPDPLDRVVGLWRPLPARDQSLATRAFTHAAPALWRSDSEPVLLATLRASEKLGVKGAPIFTLFETTASPLVRLEALQMLVANGSENLLQAVERALADSNTAVQREAIKALASVSPERSPRLLEQVLLSKADFRLKQSALTTLGKLDNPSAREILGKQMKAYRDGKLPKTLHLELLEATKTNPPVVRNGNTDAATHPVFAAMLQGGDATRGRRIFYEREDVACLRCHAIKGVGGVVGPELTGIGKRQSREYLLESVLEPNQKIAAGFENIVITLKTGPAVAGLVKSEDANELVLNSPEDGIVTVRKADIAKRETGLSSMPEGVGKILTPFELRDLVEFLASLK